VPAWLTTVGREIEDAALRLPDERGSIDREEWPARSLVLRQDPQTDYFEMTGSVPYDLVGQRHRLRFWH
jgi:hypothetical protein